MSKNTIELKNKDLEIELIKLKEKLNYYI